MMVIKSFLHRILFASIALCAMPTFCAERNTPPKQSSGYSLFGADLHIKSDETTRSFFETIEKSIHEFKVWFNTPGIDKNNAPIPSPANQINAALDPAERKRLMDLTINKFNELHQNGLKEADAFVERTNAKLLDSGTKIGDHLATELANKASNKLGEKLDQLPSLIARGSRPLALSLVGAGFAIGGVYKSIQAVNGYLELRTMDRKCDENQQACDQENDTCPELTAAQKEALRQECAKYKKDRSDKVDRIKKDALIGIAALAGGVAWIFRVTHTEPSAPHLSH